MKATGTRPPDITLPSDGTPTVTPVSSPRTSPISSPFSKNVHFARPETSDSGVTLADRILIGNKDACVFALESIPPSNSSDRAGMQELIRLIDICREKRSLPPETLEKKIHLQRWAAQMVEDVLLKPASGTEDSAPPK